MACILLASQNRSWSDAVHRGPTAKTEQLDEATVLLFKVNELGLLFSYYSIRWIVFKNSLSVFVCSLCVRFFATDSKWNKLHLTYRFQNYTLDLPRRKIREIFEKAFQV